MPAKLIKMSYPSKDYGSEGAKKTWTPEVAKQKIAAFCAYQERCQQEVRNRLYERGIFGDQAEELISWLISEGFLNEERFAKAFAGGKFRMKKWGRLKIQRELKIKKVSPNCIKSGLKEIDEDEYFQALSLVLERKANQLKESDDFKRRYKLQQYLIGRGFEQDIVQDALNRFFSGE